MAKKNTKPEKPTTSPTDTESGRSVPAPASESTEVAVNGLMTDKTKKNTPGPKVVDLKKGSPATEASKPLVVKATDGKPAKKSIPIWAWVAIGVVGLGGLTGLGVMIFGSKSATTNTADTNTTNTNSTAGLVARVIDGVLVSPTKARTNTYAVMIENITESRPQSGLNNASVVYEALAEGGITRFMALFPVGQDIPEIGPVRSARKYYVTYAEEYKPLYIHAGGAPNALTYVAQSSTNVVDFNQFRHGPNFWRDKTRPAPHNLFTSTELLLRGLRDVAPNLEPTFTSWTYQDEPSIASLPATTKDIVVNYSSFNYKATFKYDRTLNLYTRWQGDSQQRTKDGGIIQPKTVVVLFVKTSLLDGDKQRLEMETVGEGKLLMFRDGLTLTGTWKKPAASERTQFLDDQGRPLALNRGMTWISVVPTDRTVDY